MAKRHKSAIKRVLIAERNRFRNATTKSAIRTAVRKLEDSIEGNDTEKAKEVLLTAISRIDKAVSKGILHRNTGARKKSRLTKKFNSLTKTSA